MALSALRHPEKQKNAVSPALAKPAWIRARAPTSPQFFATRDLLRKSQLKTVCEEAACPNIGTCWKKKHATFMILGAVCTRACAFCNVATGKPDNLDPHEPQRLAAAAAALGLKHVVVTSVDRDDLPDGGAEQFRKTILCLRARSPTTTIEILTPDFRDKAQALDILLSAPPDIFNHNLETVPRLYPTIRPGARYFTSLELLARVKRALPHGFTKSGLMVGLGESDAEIAQVMDDLRAGGVDFLTMGQYLQPTPKHAPVKRYLSPQGFERLGARARAKGFLMVAASPMTRSSFHAGDDFQKLREAARAKKKANRQEANRKEANMNKELHSAGVSPNPRTAA